MGAQEARLELGEVALSAAHPAHRPALRLRSALAACERSRLDDIASVSGFGEPGPVVGGGGRPFGPGQAAAGPRAAPAPPRPRPRSRALHLRWPMTVCHRPL